MDFTNCELVACELRMASSKIRIANALNKSIMVRVAENEMHIKDVSLQGHVGVSVQGFEVGGESKVTCEKTLHEAGFSTIGPKMSLPFDVSWDRTKIFVSIFEENDDRLTQKYDNYSPPKSKSLLYTTSGLVPSAKDDPFVPIISQSQAALIVKADPKLAGSVTYQCGVSATGDIVCWETDQQGANKTNKKKGKK